jgi:hypothetical protein
MSLASEPNSIDPEKLQRLAADLARLYADDRQAINEAEQDRRPEDLQAARRFVQAQPVQRQRSLRSFLPAVAAGLLACLGILLFGPWTKRGEVDGRLGLNQATTELQLAPQLEVELPVVLAAGDRLGLAVFSREAEQPGELLDLNLPILSSNRWTPSAQQLEGMPPRGFLELTPQLAAGGLAEPLFVPFVVR